MSWMRKRTPFLAANVCRVNWSTLWFFIYLIRTFAGRQQLHKWLLHWFVVSCLMSIYWNMYTTERERYTITGVKQSNKNRFHLDTWLKLNQNRLKKASQPMNEAGKPVKSTITPFKHNKEKIASVILISSRVTQPSSVSLQPLSLERRVGLFWMHPEYQTGGCGLKRKLRSVLLTAPEHEED